MASIQRLERLMDDIPHIKVGNFFYIPAKVREEFRGGNYVQYGTVPFEECPFPEEIRQRQDVIVYSHGLSGECFGNSKLGFFYSPDTEAVLLALQGFDLKGKTVVSCGCGVGHHSILPAKMGARAYGIDINANAINHARENATINGLDAVFFTADYREFDYSSLMPISIATACILDCGIGGDLKLIAENTKARTIIVSGGLEERAQRILSGNGYTDFKIVQYPRQKRNCVVLIASR
jgi:ribosomal protein L11 methylase PrmA